MFKDDEMVNVKPNPSSQKGMPHYRYKGATGTVKGRRGDAYLVEVKLGNKKKMIIARPEHLVPATRG